MLKTELLKTRTPAEFDPSDKKHRKYYYDFLKTGSWRNCPYQWVISDSSIDVVHYIQKKLVEYYIEKEFEAKKTKKPNIKQVLKIKDFKKQQKRA